MWGPRGRQLWFMSDRTGAENIWVRDPKPGALAKQITKFKDGRVLWPSISSDGKTIVFERDLAVWTLDTASGKAAPVPIELRGVPAMPGTSRIAWQSGFRDLALSPDGRKVVVSARGDLYAAGAREGGTASQITATPGVERDPIWSPDNKRIAYTVDRGGIAHIFLYDFTTSKETQLTNASEPDSAPTWSPDGKRIAFGRGGTRIMVLDIASNTEHQVAPARFGLPPSTPTLTWSPDNKWIAYTDRGARQFRNVSVVSADGGTPIPVSYLPNAFAGDISWSPDGKYLLFITGQRTEPSRLARVDLIPRTPRFREDQFRELFREQPAVPTPPKPPAPTTPPVTEPTPAVAPSKNVRIVAEGIRQRLTLLPVGVDPYLQKISPDGKSLVMAATAAGQTSLWVYSLDELAREPAVPRQLTTTPGPKTDVWFTPDSREVCFLDGGRVQFVNLETRVARPVAITADVDIDFTKDRTQVFHQAWTYLRDKFFDEKFNGKDWNAMRERYAPYAEGSRSPDELRRVLSLMIGELNASHTGVAPPTPAPGTGGRLGVRFDRADYENTGTLRVTEVIRLSPADVSGIVVGDRITAVEGTAIAAGVSLDELLAHKAARRVALTVTNSPGANREVALSPITAAQERQLLYRQWAENNRSYVHRISNGRLGYVHMQDMSSESLDRLHLDLDAENLGRDGVVVDIRNNNGGFVNVYALDVLTRRPFINMTQRGFETAPARSMLGQRSLEKPTILVTNEHSLSDAEDFTEGYRAMKLGKVVGTPTAGWIIYTGEIALIDGTQLRLPATRVTDMAGKDMEMNPRPVDIPVDRPIGESYTGQDTQLDTAVRELLKQL